MKDKFYVMVIKVEANMHKNVHDSTEYGLSLKVRKLTDNKLWGTTGPVKLMTTSHLNEHSND